MPNKYNGFPKVGSGDSANVYECDMLSEAAITAVSGQLLTGATVDPVEGVTAGPSGAVEFDTASIPAAADEQLKYTGSISIEISAADVATPLGDQATAPVKDNTYYLHWNSTQDNTLPYFRLYNQGAADVIISQLSATADSIANTQAIHEVIAQETGYFNLVTSFNGLKTELYANGVFVAENDRGEYSSQINRYLRVLSLLNGAAAQEGAKAKNLVINTRPVQFSVHPMLANAVWYGDSYVDQADTVTFYLAGCTNAFDAYFRRNYGFKSNCIEAGVSGATVDDGGANNVLSQIDGTNATKPNLGLADLNPKIIMFRDFVNDVITVATDLDASIADRKAHIQTALDRNPDNHVLIGDVPSQSPSPTYDTDEIRTRVDYVNALIASLPEDMAAIDSAYSGRVHHIKQFAAFGGHEPDTKLYQLNNNHPNGFGQWMQGELYAKKAAELLG